MILDGNLAQTPGTLSAQVVIVGSGAAGLALALRLEEQGIDTLVVEAGGDKVDATAQDLYRAASVAPESHGPTHLYRRRALGGTTAIWGGRCIPFDPIDFEKRDWIAHSGWPISYEDVAAYYGPALTLCQAGAPDFTAQGSFTTQRGPMVEGVSSPDVILDRIERFSNPAHFGKLYRERLERSSKVTVLINANVTDIVTDPDGNAAQGVDIVASKSGRKLRANGQRIVIAAGGIEAPRLLLAARGAKACGLGNERDLVGRFYQAHIEGEVGELVFHAAPRDVLLDYQRTADGIYCRRYIWLSPEAQRREKTGALIGRPHHPKIVDPAHRNPILSAMYLVKDLIVSEYARKMTSTEQAAKARFGGRAYALYAEHLRNIVLGSPQLAAFSYKWVTQRILATRKLPSVVLRDPRNRYALDFNAEQSPNADSRITLGAERDRLGMQRPVIDWRTREEDYAMIARGLRTIQRAFSGSASVEYQLDDASFLEDVAACTRIGGHHIGTVRMAEDPSQGVVNGDGETFGTRGLYVCGAATFPTSGFANPTMMIVALALRMGDHLADSLRA